MSFRTISTCCIWKWFSLQLSQIGFHLESITWDCSKEGWKPLPITQAGTCGKITHLQRDIRPWQYFHISICITFKYDLTVNAIHKNTQIHHIYWKLTIGMLYSPSTMEVAIENVEEESPTIPRTGGVPVQFSCSRNCSSRPLASDNPELNPITSAPQLS